MELTHHVFSFGLYTCNLGEATTTMTNPFTGETRIVPIDNGLTDDEIEAVEEVFDKYGIEGPEPEFEGYAAYGSEGDSLRFRCYDLHDTERLTSISVEIVVRHLSDSILEVVLDVARAGNLAFTPAIGSAVSLVARRPDERVRDRWPDAKEVASVEELRTWVEVVIGSRMVSVSL